MKKTPKNIPTYYNFPGTPIFRDTTALPFAAGGPLHDRDINGNLLNSTYASPLGNMYREGGPFGEDQGTFDYASSVYASQPGNYFKDGGMLKRAVGDNGTTQVYTDKAGNTTTKFTKADGTEYIKVKNVNGKVYNKTISANQALQNKFNTLKGQLDKLQSQNNGLGPSSMGDMLKAKDIAQELGELEVNNENKLKYTPMIDKANAIGTIALTAGKYVAPKPLQKAMDIFLNVQDAKELYNNPSDELNQANTSSDILSSLQSKKTQLKPFSIAGDLITLKQKTDQFKNANNQTYNVKYTNGGPVNTSGPRVDSTPALSDSAMKAKIAYEAAMGNKAAQRMLSLDPKTYDFGNGDYGTHYMSSIDNYAVPELQDKGETQLANVGAFPPPSNEDFRFQTPEEADYFATHYKEISPMTTRQYKDGGQFQGKYSLPEDSFKQGGNNLHNSVYASSPQQYPAIYNFGGTLGNNLSTRQQMYMPLDHITRTGGSILSMSNTPEMSGEGKDLVYANGGALNNSYAGGGQIYTYAGRPGAEYRKSANGWTIRTANTNGAFIAVQDPTGKRTALLNAQAKPLVGKSAYIDQDIKNDSGHSVIFKKGGFLPQADNVEPNKKKYRTKVTDAAWPKDTVLTYKDDADYINSIANFQNILNPGVQINPEFNDQIKAQLYKGNYGFNPATGELVKLTKSEKVPIRKEDAAAVKTTLKDIGNTLGSTPEETKTYYENQSEQKGKEYANKFNENKVAVTIPDTAAWVPNFQFQGPTGMMDTSKMYGQTVYMTPEEADEFNNLSMHKSMTETMSNPLLYVPGMVASAGLSGFTIPTVLESIAGFGAKSLPFMSTVPGATVGNALNSYFIANSLYHSPQNARDWYDVSQGKQDWTNAALGTGEIALGMLGSGAGLKSIAQDVSQGSKYVGKALGTEQGLLSNTRKINPWAENLNDPLKSYRVAGMDAAKDFENSGVLRGAAEGTQYRPTAFPTFQKGYADWRYLPEEGGVVFETKLPTFKRGDINPVTGETITGRHYAHRVIDPKTGANMAEIPGSEIRMFEDKPHWLRGYQEIPKRIEQEQIVPDFSNLNLQSLPGIPGASPASLEEIRRAYHTGDRILSASEQMALTFHGAGDAANYRAIDFSRFPAASTGVSNTVMGTEIPAYLRRGLTDFSNPAQNAQRINDITAQIAPNLHRAVNVTPFNSQGINSINELENSLENWFQTNRLDSDLLENVFTSRINNVRGRYNLGNNLESELTDVVQGLSAEQKTNFINDLSTEITTLSPDELFMMRSNYGTRNLGTTTASKNYGRVNKSGLSKEEVVKQTSKEGKDAVDKMSEEEFANTVLTPSGEILPYTSKQAEAVADIPAQEYSEIFNKDLKRLNEIIAGKNKSGVPYEVESLDPSGRLTFKTLERSVPKELTDVDKAVIANAEEGLKIAEGDHATMLENNLFANADEVEQSLKGIEEYKTHIQNLQNRLKTEIIPEGTKSWGVGIKPGKWTGEVENIPSQEYYKSIPGLSISNSMSGVFADGVVRRGSGAYEAVNDYLKELNLGRVKPGFNSQTSYSKGLWENAVNKGKAMGYYGNPSVVYGSMKSLVPYIGVGGAAAGGATLLANPWQQEPKGL